LKPALKVIFFLSPRERDGARDKRNTFAPHPPLSSQRVERKNRWIKG
jgi:hypothetical protein